MVGTEFVRGNHLRVGRGIFLPQADLLGYFWICVQNMLTSRPELKSYIPDFYTVDLFMSWDEDNFIVFISTSSSTHLPRRGMDKDHLKKLRETGDNFFDKFPGVQDISELPATKEAFRSLGFEPGFAGSGSFPKSKYDEKSKEDKILIGNQLAILLMEWAEKQKYKMENSRIFLSHKGVNKPFVSKVDFALKMLNLQTWIDQDDLAAGTPLMRGVHEAFNLCSAAVFFISGDYGDSGVIRQEIDRAIHENAIRAEGFCIIPIVLTQHQGNDVNVPEPLKTLVWKSVNDIDVIPTILNALPQNMKDMIKFKHPK